MRPSVNLAERKYDDSGLSGFAPAVSLSHPPRSSSSMSPPTFTPAASPAGGSAPPNQIAARAILNPLGSSFKVTSPRTSEATAARSCVTFGAGHWMSTVAGSDASAALCSGAGRPSSSPTRLVVRRSERSRAGSGVMRSTPRQSV
jgi:hypothetical protein